MPFDRTYARLSVVLVLCLLWQFCLLSIPVGAQEMPITADAAEAETVSVGEVADPSFEDVEPTAEGTTYATALSDPVEEEDEESVGKVNTVPARFMGELFFGSDSTTCRVTDGSVTLALARDGRGISYTTVTKPTVYDTPNNAVRLVLANVSAATHINVKYTYDTEAGPRTETQRLEIDSYSARSTYLLRIDRVDTLLNMTLTFPETTGGSVVLYAMEAVRVYADDTEPYGTILSCTYYAASKTVTVKGSVYHDVMIRAINGTLELYRLAPGQTVEALLADEEAKPVAQSAISIGFELQAAAGDIAARFARYVVLLCMPDGTRVPLAGAQYARGSGTVGDAAQGESTLNRSDFKGIDTTLISSAIDSNAGSAIVDVYLNRLENEGQSGYLYTVENNYFYFDRAYLAELDACIRSLSGAACKVYLRFLAETDGSELSCAAQLSDADAAAAQYRALRADDEQSLRDLYAYTSFLCARYSGSDKGSIAGIIVGTRVDRSNLYHAAGEMLLDEYAVAFGQAFSVIAAAAQDISGSLTMVVPVSDGWNAELIGHEHRTGDYTSELFVESLARYLSNHGGAAFSLMIESTHNPYGLSNAYFETPQAGDGADASEETLPAVLVAATRDSGYLSSENMELLDSYLAIYAAQYGVLSDRYLFHWTPDDETSGNALSASYVYHYYRLFVDERASVFFVSFRAKEERGNLAEFSKIKYLVKYIDTASGSYRTSFALEVFGVDSWERLISGFDRGYTEHMTLLEGTFSDAAVDAVTGSYSLFDFEAANSSRGWYAGNHCKSLSLGYSERYGRTLDAVMYADLTTLAEYSDIAYSMEYPAVLELAPYVTLTLAVDCATDPSAVFEVKLVIGSDEGYMEAKQVVKNGELTTLTLNGAHFTNISEADYLRLSVKTVMGEDESFTLHLKSMTLGSREYDDVTLHELVLAAQRAAHGDPTTAEAEQASYRLLFFVLIATLLCTGIVIAMLSHYQKNNEDAADGERPKQNKEYNQS